jgi:hypothetical protein
MAARPHGRYQPGAADIVGSLDTRQPAGRYGDVEAITPNTDITPKGASKSAAVFAPLQPQPEGETVRERVESYQKEMAAADDVTSTIDGNQEQSQVPVGGHRLLKDGIVESVPLAGEEGDFQPHTDESAEEAIDEHTASEGGETNTDGESSDASDASSEAQVSSEPLPEGWKDGTNDDLRALASERGVEVTSSMKKAELIAAISKSTR